MSDPESICRFDGAPCGLIEAIFQLLAEGHIPLAMRQVEAPAQDRQPTSRWRIKPGLIVAFDCEVAL